MPLRNYPYNQQGYLFATISKVFIVTQRFNPIVKEVNLFYNLLFSKDL